MKVMLWLVLLIPNLMMELATWLLAPLLAVLVNQQGRLPAWLRAFETVDNTAFGDRDHAKRWSGRSQYCRFVAWFWRNPGYGFSNTVIAAPVAFPISIAGNYLVTDRP